MSDVNARLVVMENRLDELYNTRAIFDVDRRVEDYADLVTPDMYNASGVDNVLLHRVAYKGIWFCHHHYETDKTPQKDIVRFGDGSWDKHEK